jgi:hypothetical protein
LLPVYQFDDRIFSQVESIRRLFMKLLIRGGSIAAGHGVSKSYADILKESLQ